MPVSPEALQALRAEVIEAIDGGASVVTLDIDAAGVLDSPLISALISLLREARERGANVSLRASRKSILETLHITALEKVFTIVSTSDGSVASAPMPKPRPSKAALLPRLRTGRRASA